MNRLDVMKAIVGLSWLLGLALLLHPLGPVTRPALLTIAGLSLLAHAIEAALFARRHGLLWSQMAQILVFGAPHILAYRQGLAAAKAPVDTAAEPDQLLQTPDSALFNVHSLLQARITAHPGKLAFAQARGREKSGRFLYSTLSYGQLGTEVDATARGLRRAGITQGSKTLLLVRPDMNLPVIVFALFKLGAVPVIIDPAMGFRRLLACIRQVEPQAVIAPPLVHALRPFLGNTFASVDIFISTGPALGQSTRSLHAVRTHSGPCPAAPTLATDLAAIFFTSGSTGQPKGVEALHRTIAAQIAHFGSLFGAHDIALAAFPVASLIGPCLGQTSIIPDLGSLHPGRCRPQNIAQSIEDFGITSAFASPIVWERLSRHCAARDISLPTLRCALSGGAPIPYTLVERLGQLMPNGVMHTPYGATEAAPICSISAQEIALETAELSACGRGTCVGRVVEGLEVQIIAIDERSLPRWRDVTPMAAGRIGEIVVRGALVSPRYHQDPDNTARAKILADDGRDFWHRTGDTGYFDGRGRLWFCGRIRHIVHAEGKPYFSVPAEEVLNAEPEVWRSALVGVRAGSEASLCMVVEYYPEHKARIDAARVQALKDRLASLSFPVRHLLAYPHPFPVDRRHNSKIERHVLAAWAQQQLDAGRLA